MTRSRISWCVLIGLCASLLVANGSGTAVKVQALAEGVQVTLSAAHTTTSWDERDPDRRRYELPLLFLHRERESAPATDRALELVVAGLPPGAQIQVEAVSHHVDVSTGGRHVVTGRVTLPDRGCTLADPCHVYWVPDVAEMPSDFYRLRVKDEQGRLLWSNPGPDRPDFVALDTWDVRLDGYMLRVYFATLFPMARGQYDYANRLAPGAVADFIQSRFIPIIVETWKTQFDLWGFGAPVHPDWDADRLVEVIVTDPPFALFDGIGTRTRFTLADRQPYPDRRIWWLACNNSLQDYDTLEDGTKVVFAHEFLHLMQWNILLNTGHPTNFYMSVIEAQGRMIPAVQYPDLLMRARRFGRQGNSYIRAANHFLAEHLNTSLRQIEGERGNYHDMAAYWLFLYEQYGNTEVIRAALEEIAYHYDPEVVPGMSRAMDAGFGRVPGPFASYAESVVAFARASYALRLANGRCTDRNVTACAGQFYDPDGVYALPPLESELRFGGEPLTYSGMIPSSYGMDFIEIGLDRPAHGQALTVTFEAEGNTAEYDVRLWKLAPAYPRPRAATIEPEPFTRLGENRQVYHIDSLDVLTHSRIALIITRVDAGESADPVGNYSLTLGAAH